VAGDDAVRPTTRGIGRRGWTYLGGSVATVLLTGLIVPILAYVALAGAAAGSWFTRQHPIVRWALTIGAAALIAGLVLGLSTSDAQHGWRGGPITRG
jgi:hypothetical protein